VCEADSCLFAEWIIVLLHPNSEAGRETGGGIFLRAELAMNDLDTREIVLRYMGSERLGVNMSYDDD